MSFFYIMFDENVLSYYLQFVFTNRSDYLTKTQQLSCIRLSAACKVIIIIKIWMRHLCVFFFSTPTTR
jgi:hypothetical protein